jgi:hypothetical protein
LAEPWGSPALTSVLGMGTEELDMSCSNDFHTSLQWNFFPNKNYKLLSKELLNIELPLQDSPWPPGIQVSTPAFY